MEKKIYSVAGYIHSHYPEEISLEELADRFCISSSYLSHQFKNVTGFTVTDYIQMTRVRNVQALLINTSIPITEVSAPCGFNSFSQFNRVFRKHIGISPSLYRKQHQNLHSEY
jgi:AraC-like DNA-binding protein